MNKAFEIFFKFSIKILIRLVDFIKAWQRKSLLEYRHKWNKNIKLYFNLDLHYNVSGVS